jgi:hypothetical protein
VRNILLFVAIIWFVLGASVADQRGYFDSHVNRNCTFVGSALLTVVTGPVNYLGIHPRAHC